MKRTDRLPAKGLDIGNLVYKSDAKVQLGTQWNACADLFWDFKKSAVRSNSDSPRYKWQHAPAGTDAQRRALRSWLGAAWPLLRSHNGSAAVGSTAVGSGAAAGWSWCCLSNAQP